MPSSIVKEAVAAGQLLEHQQKRFKEEQSKAVVWHKTLYELSQLRHLCSKESNIEEITSLIQSL